MEEPNSTPERNDSGAWRLTAIILGLLLLVAIAAGGSNHRSYSSTSSSDEGARSAPVAASQTPKADAFTSATGAYMDGREKALYEQDPSSMGYTDADREFMREQGVSEQEMRAAETVMHRQGIDD